MLIGMNIIQMKRAIAGVYLQAILFHILIVAVQQEMYILSCMSQFCSIISTNGTSADDSISHIDHYILKCGGKVTLFICISSKKTNNFGILLGFYYLCSPF